MAKNLLIVESPAKAKTIEKFLGADFTVRSSYGHVRDLEKKGLSVDVANGFKPNYIVSPEKTKVVRELKDHARSADEVWLATDEDREGEAISWHLAEVLGLDPRTTKRIVFHEITKPAIQKAVANPRKIDLNLVDAQQARRVLDRLVGFELSELLWRKVKGGLSAGRVQSVTVKLVVERERDITNHEARPFFKIAAIFSVQNDAGKLVELKAEAPGQFETQGDAEAFLKGCIGATYSVAKIEVKPALRKPAAPFTTSTLQQEASRKLGFAVNRTMSAAQKLYEAGHITYMRTDSVNLSETAIAAISAEIVQQYGQRYLNARRYKTKNESAQEAHEAIRPSYIEHKTVSANPDEMRLYELIWKRTIASQMSDAELERTLVDVNVSTAPQARLVAEGEVLKFDGFLKVYLESKDDDEDEAKGMLPPLKIGQPLPLKTMTATERFTRPPARYTEAALVKKLEELGIGRPSTYAPTITKIMEEGRGYVVKENRDGKIREFRILTLSPDGKITPTKGSENTGGAKQHLFPTDMGMLVSDFLDEHFDKIMDYGFTAGIEKKFDEIAEGSTRWQDMLGQFYTPFHALVTDTMTNAERANKERILGKDPISGKTVLVRMGKFGPLVQLGTPEENGDEKTQYANLKGLSIETVNLEEGLNMFALPKNLGQYEGEDVIIGEGKFGPYVKYNGAFVSLPKGSLPLEVSMEQAVDLIRAKQKADAPIGYYQDMAITKGTGRFGPFIKWNGMFINIPRAHAFDTITEAECHPLIEAKIGKEANRYLQIFEAEKVMVERGRYGPFIRFGKKMITLRHADGNKMTDDEAAVLPFEDIKKLVQAEVPGAFEKKVAVKKAPAAPKKATTTAKKAPAKKAPAKK